MAGPSKLSPSAPAERSRAPEPAACRAGDRHPRRGREFYRAGLLCRRSPIYTQLLTLHDLSVGAKYGYILLYLAVFLIDDAVIFATAMLTLRAASIAGRYARASHLIGGGVLLALGALMILRPEWLG